VEAVIPIIAKGRTVDARFESNCKDAILGRIVAQDPVWECRSEAQAERVRDRGRRVDKGQAIARSIKRHGKKMGAGVGRRTDENQSGAFELRKKKERWAEAQRRKRFE
jgi:hypothetical protein